MSLISRSLLRAKPQELGKIKIGGKGAERQKQGGGSYQIPEKYDHFVVTTRVRGQNNNFVPDEAIHAKIGEKPMELRGVLMFQTVEENFHSEMAHYAGRTKKTISCDGETQTDPGTGVTKECARAKGGTCPCKPYSRLHLQLWDSPHVGGFHVFRTTSWETTNNIQTALEEVFDRFGTLYQAPVKLVLYPAEDTYEEKGETKISKSWKVGLVLAMSLEEAGQTMVASKRRLEVTRRQLSLTAGEVLADLNAADAEEAADIKDEWFPDPPRSPAADLEQELRGAAAATQAAPTVDAEIEPDDTDAPEPTPEPNEPAKKASTGMVDQLKNLRDKARAADVMDVDMEQLIQDAIDSGRDDLVRTSVSRVSLALVVARAEAGEG